MSEIEKVDQKKVDQKDLNQIFNRSWAVGAAFNNLRGQGHGCVYSLYPLINKLYPNPQDKDKKVEAIKRHELFYNITPQVNTIGLGLFAAIEEKIANHGEIDPKTVNEAKASIMGPASGIGDALFQVTIRLVAASIGLGLALNGSALGGILFFVIFNACSYVARKYCLKLSYTRGEQLVTNAASSGVIKMITDAASLLGLFMIGAVVANTVKLPLALSWGVAGGKVTLQSFFDALMPKFLPLMVILLVIYLLRKKVNANLLMVLVIMIAIIGAWIHVF